MSTLSALYCVRNEEQFIKQSINLVLPYVDEVIVVNNGSKDNTKFEIPNNPKVKVFDFPETDNMGKVRTFSLEQSTCDWFLQCDADEMYPPESMKKIREAIENPANAISFRIKYYNLSWRSDWYQSDLEHYPDRLYRRNVVEKYGGMLPNDMTMVKREYYIYRPYLEYDNASDKSFGSETFPKESAIQPIRKDIYFFHLARTRGYNFEYNKWRKYNSIHHKEDIEEITRINQWVSGLYEIKNDIEIPSYIPQNNIREPKISAIIINYNYRKYVGEAIESVMKQTYKPHEIIVVDDYSTDNSLEIIREYPVKVLARDHNGGPGATRNTGIAASTGDYFILLDADDRWKPKTLETLLRHMKGDTQVVYPDMQWFGTRTEVWRMPDFSIKNMLEKQIVPSTCALVNRHCFDLSGGFKIDIIYEDWEFWLNLTYKCKFNFKHIPTVLLEYRGHGENRCIENDKKQDIGFAELLKDYPITAEVNPGVLDSAERLVKKPRIAFVMDKIITCGGIIVSFEYVSRLKKRGYETDIYAYNRNYELENLYGIIPKTVDELSKFEDKDIIVSIWWQQVSALEKYKGRKIQLVQGNDLDAYVRDPGLTKLMKECIETRSKDNWELWGVSETALDWTGRDGKIIPNGVNERFFSDKSVEKDIDILIEGNYEPHKNIDLALRIAKSIDGTKIAWLGRSITHVSGVERFADPPQEQVPEIYKRSKVLIKLSTLEGFCLPILEAFAAKCAVVTRDMGGNTFCKHDENCLMGDGEKELETHVRKILKDDSLRKRLVDAGLKTAQEHSWKKSVDALEVYIGASPR